MKDFKKEMENRIYYELQKDPKIKELQEQQRVNTIKAKYFDILFIQFYFCTPSLYNEEQLRERLYCVRDFLRMYNDEIGK